MNSIANMDRSTGVNQSGQIVLILILIMAAALGVGLSVISRSLSDLSTSSKVEQSSRAFSAAEAGIERALQRISNTNLSTGFTVSDTELRNASANVEIYSSSPDDAVELDPIGKEQIAQFWFADPKTLGSVYSSDSFTVYFGNIDTVTDKPGVEVNVITRNTAGKFIANRYYIDSTLRIPSNGFPVTSECTGYDLGGTNINPQGGKFLCRALIPGIFGPSYIANGVPILARVRMLYSDSRQVVALQGIPGVSLPAEQVKVIVSTGTAGGTQRTVRVITQQNVVPPVFDYALFSVSDIRK